MTDSARQPAIRHAALWGLGAVGTMLAARILPRLRPGETFRVIADAGRIARYRRTPPTFNGVPLRPDYADPARPDPGAPPADLLLVAVKTAALPAARDALSPFAVPGTLVLPLLNGLSARDRLAADFGEATTLHGLVFCNSAMRNGRDVTQSGALTVQLGGPPDAARRAAGWLDAHGVPAEIPPDMRAALWRKFILNVALNQAEAATGLPHGPLLASPDAMRLFHALAGEAAAVAAAEGVPGAPRLAREALDALSLLTPDGKTSMLQDVEAGRPPEVDAFAGEIVARAARHCIPVPANQSILDRFRARP
jgi:2-dehydropantoate 2-reductase